VIFKFNFSFLIIDKPFGENYIKNRNFLGASLMGRAPAFETFAKGEKPQGKIIQFLRP
jgi:hypothetical protein